MTMMVVVMMKMSTTTNRKSLKLRLLGSYRRSRWARKPVRQPSANASLSLQKTTALTAVVVELTAAVKRELEAGAAVGMLANSVVSSRRTSTHRPHSSSSLGFIFRIL